MANQKIIEAKAEVVNEITEVAKNNASFILFDYRGLTAEETSELRKVLRESDAAYKVWKNTLTKRAMDSLKFDLDNCLEGPSAIAYSTDAIAFLLTSITTPFAISNFTVFSFISFTVP